MLVNHSTITQDEWDKGASMTTKGWTHHMDFWAFTSQKPGTIRVAVGDNKNSPHRGLFFLSTQNEDDSEWNHRIDFWVYPNKPEEIRIEQVTCILMPILQMKGGGHTPQE